MYSRVVKFCVVLTSVANLHDIGSLGSACTCILVLRLYLSACLLYCYEALDRLRVRSNVILFFLNFYNMHYLQRKAVDGLNEFFVRTARARFFDRFAERA